MAQPAAEIEVKFFDIDLGLVREKLLASGGSCKTPERLMRRMVFGGEANPSMRCTYGRVRDEGDVITMSAKYSAVANDIQSQKEAQVTVNDFESATTILEGFGLVQTDYQENKRETWQLADGTLVELETWPELPTYIEIEGASVTALQAAADGLGLDWNKHTTDSTDKLYARHYGLTDAETREKLKNITFKVS